MGQPTETLLKERKKKKKDKRVIDDVKAMEWRNDLSLAL